MTDTTPTCAKHPKVTTYLRCASCNTPICDKCAVETAVGYKCRACGTHTAGAYSKPSVLGVLGVILVGVPAGALGAFVLGGFGFWGILLAIIYGRFIGTLTLKASGRKVGLMVDILTGASIVIGGALVAFHYVFLTHAFYWSLLPIALYPLISTAVIAGAAISRMRMPWGGWWL